MAGKGMIMDDFVKVVPKQAKGYVEIVRLKLRIIGFSNKRSGLFTKLGEIVYRSRGESENVTPGSDTIRIIGEIENAEREIVDAEEAINTCKVELEKEWGQYKSEREKAKNSFSQAQSKPASPPAEKPDIIKLQPDDPEKQVIDNSDK